MIKIIKKGTRITIVFAGPLDEAFRGQLVTYSPAFSGSGFINCWKNFSIDAGLYSSS
jgi:hypothetical protein